MLLRLKTFVMDVGGELFTRGFWKELVRQSLKTVVYSAAEAGLKAVARMFQETAQKVRAQNVAPQPEEAPAATGWTRPTVVPAEQPVSEAHWTGRAMGVSDWKQRDPVFIEGFGDEPEYTKDPEEAEREAGFLFHTRSTRS